MPTPSERRALVLLTVVAVLGVAARLSGATRSAAVATPEQLRALDAQIARVESARAERRARTARSGGASKASGRSGRGGADGAAGVTRPRAPSSPTQGDARRVLVDLDVADAAAIEGLPWIGPALAERIVANRLRCGPFGSLAALQRVPGIGEGIARRLEPHVTFSTPSRPISAPAGCTGAGKRATSPDRGGSP